MTLHQRALTEHLLQTNVPITKLVLTEILSSMKYRIESLMFMQMHLFKFYIYNFSKEIHKNMQIVEKQQQKQIRHQSILILELGPSSNKSILDI